MSERDDRYARPDLPSNTAEFRAAPDVSASTAQFQRFVAEERQAGQPGQPGQPWAAEAWPEQPWAGQPASGRSNRSLVIVAGVLLAVAVIVGLVVAFG